MIFKFLFFTYFTFLTLNSFFLILFLYSNIKIIKARNIYPLITAQMPQFSYLVLHICAEENANIISRRLRDFKNNSQDQKLKSLPPH